MNKQQKELQQVFLDSEKEVLNKLKKNYQDALDEINSKIQILMARDDSDLTHVMYQVVYQEALKKQVESVLNTLQANEFETVSEYLAKSYEDGFIGTLYDLQGQGVPLIMPIDQEQVVAAIQHETKLSTDLYTALGKDIKDLQKKISSEISRGISVGQMYSEISRNIASYAGISRNKAMRIARTEGHRIQCKATSDAQFKAKDKGADIVKQWDAALDRKTRKSHRELDGQIRGLEEEFEVNKHKAMMPGGFNIAEEDINCRCALLQRARWALGNEYTKWSPDAPILINDDGATQLIKVDANNFKEFKGYYQDMTGQMTMNMEMKNERVRSSVPKINSQDTLEKSSKSSKIKPKELTDNEVKAVNDYISTKSYVVNEKLRNGLKLDQEEKEFVENLDKALDKMPAFEGNLQRSLYFYSDEDLESFMNTHQVGVKVEYNEFISTSKGEVYNPEGQVQIFIQDSKSGKDISTLNSNEDEVLYKRASSFRVLNVIEHEDKYYILVVEDYE